MGLRSRAWKYRSGLKARAAYFRTHTEETQTEDAHLKKEQYLETLLEISQEIYRTLNPEDLMNILLLTFMGQTRSQRGALVLKEQNRFVVKNNKGIAESFFETQNFYAITAPFAASSGEVLLPLMGRQWVLGFIVLSNTGLSGPEDEEMILKPLLSLGGIALENALLYAGVQKKLKQMSALYEIGDTLTRSANLEEILFLAFSTLEYGFKMKKILLLSKNDQNEFQVLDGFGCREETHRRFKISVHSEHFKNLPFKHPENLKDHGHFPWKNLLDEEDYQESNTGLFIPLKVYGQVSGYLVILQTEETPDEPEWAHKLYQLLGTYFAFSFSLMAAQQQEATLSVGKILSKALEEPFHFCEKMGLSLVFYLVSDFDEKKSAAWISNQKGKAVRLMFGKTLLMLPYEEDSELESFSSEIQSHGVNIEKTLSNPEKGIASVLEVLGLD